MIASSALKASEAHFLQLKRAFLVQAAPNVCMIEWASMVDIKSTVSVVVALMVGALAGGLVGHFAVPSREKVSSGVVSGAPCST